MGHGTRTAFDLGIPNPAVADGAQRRFEFAGAAFFAPFAKGAGFGSCRLKNPVAKTPSAIRLASRVRNSCVRIQQLRQTPAPFKNRSVRHPKNPHQKLVHQPSTRWEFTGKLRDTLRRTLSVGRHVEPKLVKPIRIVLNFRRMRRLWR